MKHSIIAAALSMAAMPAAATGFDTAFADSTLRVDYILGGDASRCHIALAGQKKSACWAGRRHNLDRPPYEGNGRVTVTDEASGDTLYVNSFSTLFQEWLATDEARVIPRAMEHTVLVPLPQRKACIELVLLDNRHEPTARMTHVYRPDDELVAVSDAHRVAPHRYLHRGGDSRRAIDVAIVGEGYTAAEMDSFYVHAARAVGAIMSYEPFKSHSGNFNFVAVEACSSESGVSTPRLGDWKKTAFSSHFSTFYSDRYLTTGRVFAIHDALTGVAYEHIIVLANTDEYGGGGIYNSYTLTAARHPLFEPVVVHEFGHSFGGLADEYFYDDDDLMESLYPLDVEPWEPNITTLVDFGRKWRDMLAPDTPVPTPADSVAQFPAGVYEGGGYLAKGIYRPADECRMRNNTWPVFCPACEDALDSLIRFYVATEQK